LIMHYTGMMALRGPFRKSWSIPFVASSTVLGIVVCLVGFWIIFRLLKWKVEQTWLRPVSAAVIAMAVCSLHFFAMLGVTYTYDASNVETCGHVVQIFEHDPNQWTTHQIVALAVALSVPSLALLIENMISRELFHAYRQLKNPALTVEYILKMASKSKDAEVRRLSDDFCDSVDLHDFHRKPRRARSHGDLNLMAHSSDLECGERSTSESLG